MNYKYDNIGLVEEKREGTNCICNCKPIVDAVYTVSKQGSINESTIIKYHYKIFGKIIKEEIMESDFTSILDGSFIRKRPSYVIIQPNKVNRVTQYFIMDIQTQMIDKVKEEYILVPNGWFNKKYYWEQTLVNKSSDNVSCSNDDIKEIMKLIQVILNEPNVLPVFLLASVMGPLNYLLKEAGVNHNFITFVVGSTGVGKTDLIKFFSAYNTEDSFISLTSDRKDVLSKILSYSDVTLGVDDFCITDSKRVKEKNIQLVSEIIQRTCDSAKLVVGDEVKEIKAHIIISGEKLILNPSTFNRCFVINMDKQLESCVWEELVLLNKQRAVYSFIKSFVFYCQNNYDTILSHISEEYEYYRKNSSTITLNGEVKGINRIVSTEAIMFIATNLIVQFLKSSQIPTVLTQKVEQVFNRCVKECIGAQIELIKDIYAKDNRNKYLPHMASIFNDIEVQFSYRFPQSEKKYNKLLIERIYECGGCLIHDGYISITGDHLGKLLGSVMDTEPIPAKSFSAELNYYNLAYKNADGEMSTRWGTQKRMYHIRYKELKVLVDG